MVVSKGAKNAGSRVGECRERRGRRNGRRQANAMHRTQGREAPEGQMRVRNGAARWDAVTTGARSRMR